MDLTVEGNIYTNNAFQHCCIGIENGIITSIKKQLKGNQYLRFPNALILPAGIDLHVHFRDPGGTHKEDFSSGTQAAAYGGITCIFDMPNTRPPTTTRRSLLKKEQTGIAKSYIDFGLYAMITDSNIGTLSELSPHCAGFKLYMGETTDTSGLDAKHLSAIFKATMETTKRTAIHAEDRSCLQRSKADENSLKDHLSTRPASCEEQAIQQVLDAHTHHSSPLHICHLSSCEGFELLRKKPSSISIGVTPHHLLFDVDMISQNQTYFKVNPPLRTHFDREMLWYGLQHGLIDVIESDHAPHTLEEKSMAFDEAPSGIPGVETMYPLFLSQANKKILSYNRVVQLLCERPAELMNIPKGKIAVGYDADFIVISPKASKKIASDDLHSKCGWTPYESMNALFPSHVFLRGEPLIEEGELVAKQGTGSLITPQVQ